MKTLEPVALSLLLPRTTAAADAELFAAAD